MKALILAGMAVPALVTTAHMDFHDHVHAHLHDLLVKKLDLTQDQQDAAKRIMIAHHPALQAKAHAAFKLRADLVQALTDPETTEAQLRDLETQAAAAHLALDLEVSQAVKELAPLLTPEQRVKARQLVVDARAHVEGFLAGLAAKH